MGLNGPHFDVPLILVRILAQNRGEKNGERPFEGIAYSSRRFFARPDGRNSMRLIYRKGRGECLLAFLLGSSGRNVSFCARRYGGEGIGCKLPRFGGEIGEDWRQI